MSVTVLTSVKNSEQVAGAKFQLVCAFTNSGASAVTVIGVNQLAPPGQAGPIVDDAVKLNGLSLAAGVTTNGIVNLEIPAASNLVGDKYSLAYSFMLSDGTIITPTQNPQIWVRNPNGLSVRETFRLPPAGALDFRSNIQSGLIPVLFGIRPTSPAQ